MLLLKEGAAVDELVQRVMLVVLTKLLVVVDRRAARVKHQPWPPVRKT